MGFPYKCKFCEYEGKEFTIPDIYWEVLNIVCPACGAKYFVEREIIYQYEIESRPTKEEWEIDEFFDPELKKNRIEREKKEDFEKLSSAKKLEEIGKSQSNKILNYL